MKFTGERMVPEVNGHTIIFIEHMLRYYYASRYCAGKRVLDVACGVGYGSRTIMEAGAESVVGVDISAEAIAYASERYLMPNVSFVCAPAEDTPFPDRSFDVIISFETIEHISDYRKFLSEVRRLLKHDGVVIISTPNKDASDGNNPWHYHEFNREELLDLLDEYFPQYCKHLHYQRLGIYCSIGDRSNSIVPEYIAYPDDKQYFVCVVSASSLQEEFVVGLGPLDEVNMLRQRIYGLEDSVSLVEKDNAQIKQALNEELARRDMQWAREIRQREKVIFERDRELAEVRLEISKRSQEVERELAKREELWAGEVTQRESVIYERDREVCELRLEITKRSEEMMRELDKRQEFWDAADEGQKAIILARDQEIAQLQEEIARLDSIVKEKETLLSEMGDRLRKRRCWFF